MFYSKRCWAVPQVLFPPPLCKAWMLLLGRPVGHELHTFVKGQLSLLQKYWWWCPLLPRSLMDCPEQMVGQAGPSLVESHWGSQAVLQHRESLNYSFCSTTLENWQSQGPPELSWSKHWDPGSGGAAVPVQREQPVPSSPRLLFRCSNSCRDELASFGGLARSALLWIQLTDGLQSSSIPCRWWKKGVWQVLAPHC